MSGGILQKGIVGFDLGIPGGSFVPSGAAAAVGAQEEGAVSALSSCSPAGASRQRSPAVPQQERSVAASPTPGARAEALAVALQLLLLQACVLCLSQQ